MYLLLRLPVRLRRLRVKRMKELCPQHPLIRYRCCSADFLHPSRYQVHHHPKTQWNCRSPCCFGDVRSQQVLDAALLYQRKTELKYS